MDVDTIEASGVIADNGVVPTCTLRWMGDDTPNKYQISVSSGTNFLDEWFPTNTTASSTDNAWFHGSGSKAYFARPTLTVPKRTDSTTNVTGSHLGIVSPGPSVGQQNTIAGNSGLFMGGTTWFVTFSISTRTGTVDSRITSVLTSHNSAWVTGGNNDPCMIGFNNGGVMILLMWYNSSGGLVTRLGFNTLMPCQTVAVNRPQTIGITLVPNTRDVKVIGNNPLTYTNGVPDPRVYTYSTATPVIRETYNLSQKNEVTLGGQRFRNTNGTFTSSSNYDQNPITYHDIRYFDRVLSDEEMRQTYDRMVNAFQDPGVSYSSITKPTYTW